MPSSAGSFGNSLAAIDPTTGTVNTPVFIGSEPRKLAISDNNQYIYAGLDGVAGARRFDLASQTPGLQFGIGNGQFSGALFVEDMAVMPGNPNAVAISRRNQGFSPRHEGVGIYDNGVVRSVTTPGHTGSNVIEYSSNASTLYGYNNETTEYGFRKMAASSSGVAVTSTVSNVISGFGVDIKYDNGSIFTTSGLVLNAETAALTGRFTDAFGLVVPDSAAGRVYFLTGLGSSTLTLKVFDLNTFTQTGTLNITGVSGTPGSFIKWGANGLAFRTANQVYFISTSAINPIPPTPLPTPVQVASGIIRLPLAANDLVYDPNTQKIYASIPGSAGSFGNSLAAINPTTGAMSTPVFIGSEPSRLAISDNNQYIYAGLDGVAAARRFDLASQTAGLQFALGNGQFNGALYVEDIAVMLGNPNVIAVSRKNSGFSPRHEGVGVYDNGVVRSVATAGHTGSNVIEFSSNASTLYGYNNETTEFGLRKMAVNSSGVTVTSTFSNLISGFGSDIRYSGGVIYSSSGRAVNPDTGSLLGTFSGVNTQAFVPDSTVGRIYFVNSSGGSTTLHAFNVNTFLPTGSLTIPGVVGLPSSLIRWGSNGLAFRTSGNQVFIIQTSLVPPSSSLQLSASSYNFGEGSEHVEVTVNRAGTSAPASVNYATSDTLGIDKNCQDMMGIASSRCDYGTSLGTLRFAAGESSKTIFIPVVDDAYAEGNESFTITLSNAVGAPIGTQASATIVLQDNDSTNGANPIDGVDFFIRQQYIDFLGREPDPAGLAGWRNVLNNCGTTVAPPCDRIEVSAGFFRSEEFQSRGYFIYRFFSALGKIPVSGEFYPDFAKVSGFLTAEQLEANKAAYVNEVMARADFQTKYGSTLNNPTAYVDALLQTVGLPNHPGRAGWINTLNTNNTTQTRGQVLRQLVESGEVFNKYFNEAFVIMQYFGYLRRTADASYLNWIQTMNQTNGDYRIMINGFMNSSEYRRRFGP